MPKSKACAQVDDLHTREVSRPIGLATTTVAVSLALWATAMHIPMRGLRGPDDGFFLAVAHFWAEGAPPYLHAFDVKPPGLFALLAVAQSLFGPSQATLNGLMAFCDAISALALWRIGRRLAGPAVGVFAGFGYPILSQMLAANPGYPPLGAATTTAFALALSSYALTLRAALAGLAIGFAVTIKQTAALEAFALIWMVLRDPDAKGRRLKVGLAFVAGAATAPFGFALLLAAEGALAPFLADVVVTAMQRPMMEAEPLSRILLEFAAIQAAIWPIATLAAIGAIRWRSLFPGAPAGRAEGAALWLAASWLELAVQDSRWFDYLSPIFAPILLLSGAAIAAWSPSERVKDFRLAAFLAATIGAAYPYRYWPHLAPDDAPEVAAVARVIANQRPSSQDRLLAIGADAKINVASGLAPPTPYFHYLHLLCEFPGAGPARLREALAAAPRFLVLANSQLSRPFCLSPAAWPLIDAAIARSYRRIAQAPAEAPGFYIYERAIDVR